MRIKLFIFILLFSLPALAQTQKQLITYADNNFDLGDYYGASLYYKQAMNNDSSDIHLTYKYATALRKYNNYELAAYYYEKITQKDRGGRIYKDAFFWLAMMQKNNGDYRNSAKSWKKSKSIYKKNKKSYEYLKSVQELISCSYAMRMQYDTLKDVRIVHLAEEVNTTQSEFGGILVDSTFYFSSLRADHIGDDFVITDPKSYKSKIYTNAPFIAEKSYPIDTMVNSELTHQANGCFNSDQTIFYFTRCDSLTNCKLYSSKFNHGTWSIPIELPSSINANGSTTTQPHVAMVEGKEYLFFVSNRSGGEGNLDIWQAEILDNNTFGNIKNVGKEINTPDAEITPFYNVDEKTLYFSSTWHSGFGGFDVFKAKGFYTTYDSPENLGIPINTSYNDMYYSIHSPQRAFITSNRKGIFYEKGPTCCNDIWQINTKKEEPLIVTERTIETLDDLNKYLPVTLYFHNDRPGPRSLDTIVDISYMKSYDYYKTLQGTYRKEYAKGLSGEEELEAKLDIDDFFKHYVDQGVEDLDLFTRLLLEELNKGEKIEVTIKGFASPLAKTDYNINLTKRRISSLINYLREYGKGEFNAYIDKSAENGGELTFQQIPFGEYTASNSVSDDYYDQRNSIYNRKAALERKIEIQSVRKANFQDSVYAEMQVDMSTHDFGKATNGDLLQHTFVITNTGNKPLIIKKVVSSCSCNTINFTETSIAPGGKGEITVVMDTKNMNGKQVKSITIIADAFPTTKRLVLTAEIFRE